MAISRLSNNLNQIARDLNSALKYGNPIDILNTQAKLVEILNEAIKIEDCARRIEKGDERLAIFAYFESDRKLWDVIMEYLDKKNSI